MILSCNILILLLPFIVAINFSFGIYGVVYVYVTASTTINMNLYLFCQGEGAYAHTIIRNIKPTPIEKFCHALQNRGFTTNINGFIIQRVRMLLSRIIEEEGFSN